MAVKMRLQRHGSKKRPFYFIVVADGRAPRDGKFIQKLGTYNPLTVPATIQVDRQKALDWLQKGAQPTDTVRRILSFKGVLYLKHLLRGVSLGLFDEAGAMEKFTAWTTEHDSNVARRQGAHKKARSDSRDQPVVKKVEALRLKLNLLMHLLLILRKLQLPHQHLKKPKQKNNNLCSVNSFKS